MNREQLAIFVAARMDLSKKEARETVTAVLDGILDGLEADGRVALDAFGTWYLKDRAAHIARNPQTGERFLAPMARVMRFRTSDRISNSLKAGELPLSSRKRPKGSLEGEK